MSQSPRLLTGLLLLAASAAPAQPPVAKPEPVAEKWIAQLADIDYRKRDEASQALQRLGDKALPALRAARKHTDPEVRRRANELASAVETATLLAPKLVTLTVKGKGARDIAAELARVTGYKVECWGNFDNSTFDFAWKDVPFWDAVDQFCRGAGLTIQPSYGDDRLRLQAQQKYAPYSVRDGAFRLIANGFQQTRGIDFAALSLGRPEARRNDGMTFAFTVHAEPRLPLLGIGEVKLNAAYDDEGNSLLPAAVDASPDGQVMQQQRTSRYYGGKTLSIPTDVALSRPSTKARTARVVRGSVPVTVLTEQRPEVVSDKLAKGQKVKVGTTTFSIDDIGENPQKQPQVKMTISEDNAAGDHTWSNSLYNRIEMYDEKGQRMNNYGSSWSTSNNSVVTITFNYGPAGAANAGKPTKLVFHVWSTLHTQVGFEFKDLPLP